jgi:acetoacetyl-CoA reductase
MARVALVTGGTRGIGAAISKALMQAGRTVVASYAGNEEAASAFGRETGIRTMKFDACDFDACAKAVEIITAEIGPIEILVNNAGITRDGTMARMTRDMWDAVIDTNLGSCFNLCKLTFDGITVNAIAPGYVDTDMVRAVPPDVLEKIIARIPAGRLGRAEDIARGVVFLTADDADFVTGSTMSINGGQHMY